MALPGVTQNILDGGMGVTKPATSTPHFVGVSAFGPINTPTVVANQRILREVFGTEGAVVDAAGHTLDLAGGPVVVTRTASTTTATYNTAASDELAPSGGIGADDGIDVDVSTSAPRFDADLLVTIVAGGVLGGTTFTYSLDGGITTSPTIDAGSSIALGSSGIVLEFQAGSTDAFVAGETYVATVRAQMYDATDLAAAFTAIDASLLTWDFFVFTGQAATAAAAAVIAATVSSKMFAYENQDRYYRALMSAGDDTAAAVLTAFATAFVSTRVGIMYGTHAAPPPFGTTGRGLPSLPAVDVVARLASGNSMSTDLAQVSGASSVGALPTTLSISHNEFTQEAGLDAKKIGTLRTYPNSPGFYVTNVWLKSGAGSDFEFWQHGQIMDKACKEVSFQHTQLVSSSVVTKADGTGSLVEFAALSIEKRVQRGLDNTVGSALREVGPNAIDGTTGHVSDIKYQVDRGNNVLSTKTLIATVSIVPRGYLKRLTTTLSYKLST